MKALSEEIDICPECIHYGGSACTLDLIIDDERYDPDLMVDECVHFED